MHKTIFVTGGVCSSLGKGICASSIGALIEARGLKVCMVKIDPYLNVDAGTMNPYQHGEVFVTDDGAETDLDLGNYSRFTQSVLSRANSITTGQVYQEVIRKERAGQFLGRTVQVIPHVTDEIKHRILCASQDSKAEITIIEIGGTVGDIESIPFLEAARQVLHERGRTNSLCILVTLVPTVPGGELKTKPTQHAVKELQEVGIQPEILILRAKEAMDETLRRKIASFTNVDFEGIFSASDAKDTVYELPEKLHSQKLDSFILKTLKIGTNEADLKPWLTVVRTFKEPKSRVRIGVLGKYMELHDSYKSVWEALFHGGIANEVAVDIVKINSQKLDIQESDATDHFIGIDGLLVPGGYGQRGSDGMIKGIRWARENLIPYFGICLGMQMMAIEWARNILGWKDADSTEFNPETSHPVVSLLQDQIDVKNYGGTQRLGAGDSILKPGSLIQQIYGATLVRERHRHRYEFSNTYRSDFEKSGLSISGQTLDNSLVESIEWLDHPWGIGVQFHPEFKSRPIQPAPLFTSFISACIHNPHKKNSQTALP